MRHFAAFLLLAVPLGCGSPSATTTVDAGTGADTGTGADAGMSGPDDKYMGVRQISSGWPALSQPFGVAVDGAGNVWVADTANGLVRKLDAAGVTLAAIDGHVAGATAFGAPMGVAIDRSTGDVWVSDPATNLVQGFTPTGAFIASISGPLAEPYGLAVDGAGHIFVADTGNDVVRELSAAGTPLATFGAGDLMAPWGVALDAAGNLWVTDTGHDVVREYGASGTQLAAFDGTEAGGTAFQTPAALAIDSAGNLWIADAGNSLVQELSATGAFVARFDASGAGDSPLFTPQAVAIGGDGDVWIADGVTSVLHRYDAAGTIVGIIDGGTTAFANPRGVAIDSAGNVWVADTGNGVVDELDATGAILAAADGSQPGGDVFSGPLGVAFAGDGSRWIADPGSQSVRKLDATGAEILDVGGFVEPRAGAVDAAGNVWVADSAAANLVELSPQGVVLATLDSAHGTTLTAPSGLAIDPATGNLWVADGGARVVLSLSPAGAVVAMLDGNEAGATPFVSPAGLALDAAGDVWIADPGNGLVQELSPSGAWLATLDGNEAGAVPFDAPSAVAVDAAGDVWVADPGLNLVEELAPTANGTRRIPARRSQAGALPAELQFSGTASYLVQQYDPDSPDDVLYYQGAATWSIVYVYSPDNGTYVADAGRSKVSGTRSKYATSGPLCSGPATLIDPTQLGQMTATILMEGTSSSVSLPLPTLDLTGCDTAAGNMVMSPFAPPIGGTVPDFPHGYLARFPTANLIQGSSRILWQTSFQGFAKHPPMTVGDGTTRINIASWTLTARLAGVAPGSYVSLGDSFSSGVGAPGFDPSSGACLRSPRSYGATFDPRSPQNTIFVACSGSTTAFMRQAFGGQPAQLDTIPVSAKKVSVTIGGNDADLFGTLRWCVLDSFLFVPCQNVIGASAMAKAQSILPAVQSMLSSIKAAAPSAMVAILEYPNPFPAERVDCDPLLRGGLLGPNVEFLHGLLVTVNTEVQAAAQGAGGVTFVPTAPEFVGHDACGDSPWFELLTGGPGTLHPNTPGNMGMKDALAGAIGVPN